MDSVKTIIFMTAILSFTHQLYAGAVVSSGSGTLGDSVSNGVPAQYICRGETVVGDPASYWTTTKYTISVFNRLNSLKQYLVRVSTSSYCSGLACGGDIQNEFLPFYAYGSHAPSEDPGQDTVTFDATEGSLHLEWKTGNEYEGTIFIDTTDISIDNLQLPCWRV